jgi:6-phosphogluconate dehydrogenase (decarboxylating)
MDIGFLGLGRMGFPLCALLKRNHDIVAFDPMSPARERAKIVNQRQANLLLVTDNDH